MPAAFVPEAQKWFPPQGVGPRAPAASRGIGYDSERIRDITELSLWLAAIGAGTGAGVGVLNRIKDDIRGEKKKRMSLVTSALLGAGAGAGLGLSTGIDTLEAKPGAEKQALPLLALPAIPVVAAKAVSIAGLAMSAMGLAFDAYDVHRYGRLSQKAKAAGNMKQYRSYKALQSMAAASLPASALPSVSTAKNTSRLARWFPKAVAMARRVPPKAKAVAANSWALREFGAAPLMDPSRYPGYAGGTLKTKSELDRISRDHAQRFRKDLTQRARTHLNMPAPAAVPTHVRPAAKFVPEAMRYFPKRGSLDPTLDNLYAAIANDNRLGAQEKLDTIARIKAAVGSGSRGSVSLSELAASGLGGILGYWVSRYFGTGVLGSLLLSSAGVYAGNRAHGAFTAKDPTPGWRILR